jgi:hypothetical protein
MNMPQSSHCHPDLFALDEPPMPPLTEIERTRLLPLISALLREILEVIAEVEASNDEDHA